MSIDGAGNVTTPESSPQNQEPEYRKSTSLGYTDDLKAGDRVSGNLHGPHRLRFGAQESEKSRPFSVQFLFSSEMKFHCHHSLGAKFSQCESQPEFVLHGFVWGKHFR